MTAILRPDCPYAPLFPRGIPIRGHPFVGTFGKREEQEHAYMVDFGRLMGLEIIALTMAVYLLTDFKNEVSYESAKAEMIARGIPLRIRWIKKTV